MLISRVRHDHLADDDAVTSAWRCPTLLRHVFVDHITGAICRRRPPSRNLEDFEELEKPLTRLRRFRLPTMLNGSIGHAE